MKPASILLSCNIVSFLVSLWEHSLHFQICPTWKTMGSRAIFTCGQKPSFESSLDGGTGQNKFTILSLWCFVFTLPSARVADRMRDDFAWDFRPALCRTLLRVRGLEMVLRHDRQCTWVRGRLQWEVLWGRTSYYTKKLMTVLLYIMDSIFRRTFVPLAWLHCARGQQPRHYVLNIEIFEILEHQGKCKLRCISTSA